MCIISIKFVGATMELKFKHFIALNIADILLTWYAITYLGLVEGNPILLPIFQQIGLITGLVCIKLIVIGMIATLRNHMPLNIKKISINIICFMFVLVVANNIYQICLV